MSDDAVVDVEGRLVRTAVAVDTADIRVLAIVGEPKTDEVGRSLPQGDISVGDIVERWSGVQPVVGSILSALGGAGLVENGAYGNTDLENHWRVTNYGQHFLRRLLDEGLEDELAVRGSRG